MRCRAIAFALACAACTGQNLYTTPRTVAKDGGHEIVIAPEAYFAKRGRNLRLGGVNREIGPTMQVIYRGPITDRVEWGAHSGTSAWGADLKWNPIRTDIFDVALAARGSLALAGTRAKDLQFYGGANGYLHLPLLFGIKAGPLTFIVSPGLTGAIDQRGRANWATRIGGAIRVRFGQWFAIQPEVSWIEELSDRDLLEMGVVAVGIGFAFGKLPAY